MSRNQYVILRDDKWMVRDASAFEEPHFFSSLMDAIQYARTIANKYSSEAIIFDNCLNILGSASFANNPDHS